MTATTPITIRVLERRLSEAKAEITKIAAKARRYGCAEIEWTVSEPYTVEIDRERVPFVDVEVSTDALVRIGDHKLVAKISRAHNSDDVLIDTVPGEEVPAEWFGRRNDGRCDHCAKSRARTNVFLVRDGEGNLMQVGRTCLQDYLGRTPSQVIWAFGFEKLVRESLDEFGGAGERTAGVREVLAVTHAVSRLWGWVPRSAPESAGEPTAETVMDVLFGQNRYAQAIRKEVTDAMTEADYEAAEAAIAWVEAGEPTSSYTHNLRVLVGAGYVEASRISLLASLIGAYKRDLLKREQEERAVAESRWVGTVGERIRNVPATVEAARGMSGAYGETVLFKLRTDDGAVLTWFCSGAVRADVGDRVRVTATVKAHKEFRGAQETQITRAKIEAAEEAA